MKEYIDLSHKNAEAKQKIRRKFQKFLIFFEKTIDRRGMHEYDIMWLAKANYFKNAQLA